MPRVLSTCRMSHIVHALSPTGTDCLFGAPLPNPVAHFDSLPWYSRSTVTVQVDYGSLVHSPNKCVRVLLAHIFSAQICSERAGDYSSSTKE